MIKQKIIFNTKFKFSSYTSEGMWDDSNGDYGNEKCSGYVKQIKKKMCIEVLYSGVYRKY